MNRTELRERILQKAGELGFCAAGIAAPGKMEQPARMLEMMVAEGRHGQMTWLATQKNERRNPSLLFPNLASVLCVAYPAAAHKEKTNPYLARYALREDYHAVMKRKLGLLLQTIEELSDTPVKGMACVDSSPVFEKAWAERAGILRTGKHTLGIIPGWGSNIMLGELLLDMHLEPTTTDVTDPCAHCNRCLQACPTGALTVAGRIDARKCIAYLTIEHKGEFSEKEEKMIGTHLFGCDICQDACPHNGQAGSVTDQTTTSAVREPLLELTPEKVITLTRSSFKALCAGTPIYRTGLKRLKRNARAVLKNRDVL